jgi:uncharacterized membrane protein HdeD (DUF308 family)
VRYEGERLAPFGRRPCLGKEDAMGPDIPAVTFGRRILQREAARWWWAPLVAGVIWFVIAWLVLRADYTSLATVGVLVGVVFLIAAVNETALAAAMGGGWAVWHVVLAVFLVLGAIWAFVRPVNTFFALASVLGLLLFLQGAFTLMRGIALREVTSYWWLDVVCGGLLTALGLWVSTSDRVWTLGARAAFVLLWVGFMAIFNGVSDIAMGFALHRFGHEQAREQPQAAAGAAPMPAQRQEAPAQQTDGGSGPLAST